MALDSAESNYWLALAPTFFLERCAFAGPRCWTKRSNEAFERILAGDLIQAFSALGGGQVPAAQFPAASHPPARPKRRTRLRIGVPVQSADGAPERGCARRLKWRSAGARDAPRQDKRSRSVPGRRPHCRAHRARHTLETPLRWSRWSSWRRSPGTRVPRPRPESGGGARSIYRHGLASESSSAARGPITITCAPLAKRPAAFAAAILPAPTTTHFFAFSFSRIGNNDTSARFMLQ